MMNDTIIGVVIGGLIASIGTWISMWLHHKQWKSEQKIKVLERKRNKFETLSIKTLENIKDGMENKSYSSEMISDIKILFPENVFKEFNHFMHIKDKKTKDFRSFFYRFTLEINKVIANIDKEIDEILH